MSGQETEKDGRKVKPAPLPISDAEAAELAELMENEKREWKKRAQLKIRPPLSERPNFQKMARDSQITPAEVLRIVAEAWRRYQGGLLCESFGTLLDAEADKLEASARAASGAGDEVPYEPHSWNSLGIGLNCRDCGLPKDHPIHGALAAASPAPPLPQSVKDEVSAIVDAVIPPAPAAGDMLPCRPFSIELDDELTDLLAEVISVDAGGALVIAENAGRRIYAAIVGVAPAPSGHLTHEQGAGYGAAPSVSPPPPAPQTSGERDFRDEGRQQMQIIVSETDNIVAATKHYGVSPSVRAVQAAAKKLDAILTDAFRSPVPQTTGLSFQQCRHSDGESCLKRLVRGVEICADCPQRDDLSRYQRAELGVRETDEAAPQATEGYGTCFECSAPLYKPSPSLGPVCLKCNPDPRIVTPAPEPTGELVKEWADKRLSNGWAVGTSLIVTGDKLASALEQQAREIAIQTQIRHAAEKALDGATDRFVNAEREAAALREKVKQISEWPDGGNRYGHIKRFALAALSPASGKAGTTAESKGGDNG